MVTADNTRQDIYAGKAAPPGWGDSQLFMLAARLSDRMLPNEINAIVEDLKSCVFPTSRWAVLERYDPEFYRQLRRVGCNLPMVNLNLITDQAYNEVYKEISQLWERINDEQGTPPAYSEPNGFRKVIFWNVLQRLYAERKSAKPVNGNYVAQALVTAS